MAFLSSLALSDSFEYLCYGSTAIINIVTLTESDVCRRQIMTTKFNPRTVRVNRGQVLEMTEMTEMSQVFVWVQSVAGTSSFKFCFSHDGLRKSRASGENYLTLTALG